jgi:uncharacterized membrane protein
MMDWDGGMWGGGWVMFLFSTAFLVAVIVGIVLVVRALSGSGAGGDHQASRASARHPRSLCVGATPRARSTARSTSRN